MPWVPAERSRRSPSAAAASAAPASAARRASTCSPSAVLYADTALPDERAVARVERLDGLVDQRRRGALAEEAALQLVELGDRPGGVDGVRRLGARPVEQRLGLREVHDRPRRCRAASKRSTVVAMATLSDSAAGSIGIVDGRVERRYDGVGEAVRLVARGRARRAR